MFSHNYSLLYGNLACRKSIKNKLLLLNNSAESIQGIFHKNAQLSYNKRRKHLLKVSDDHKVSNNVS